MFEDGSKVGINVYRMTLCIDLFIYLFGSEVKIELWEEVRKDGRNWTDDSGLGARGDP